MSKANINRTKGKETDNNIIVEDFNTPLISMDKSPRWKISKETAAMNDTLDQMDLIYIHRTSHPKQQNKNSFQVHIEHSPE